MYTTLHAYMHDLLDVPISTLFNIRDYVAAVGKYT